MKIINLSGEFVVVVIVPDVLGPPELNVGAIIGTKLIKLF